MNLERELQLLAAEIAWPPTPELASRVASVLASQRGVAPPRGIAWRRHVALRHAPGRRPLVLAVALLLVALGAAFAVPESRGAILRFLHLGGVTIERVDQLPPAQERPLGADIGRIVSRRVAQRALGQPPLLPPLDPLPPLHLEGEDFVSLVFLDHGEPVQLSELGHTDEGIFKKLVVGATSTRFVDVDGAQGIWLSGARHVFAFPHVPPRLAGNVLIWQRGRLTLRLEGRRLTLDHALGVAHSLRRAKM